MLVSIVFNSYVNIGLLNQDPLASGHKKIVVGLFLNRILTLFFNFFMFPHLSVVYCLVWFWDYVRYFWIWKNIIIQVDSCNVTEIRLLFSYLSVFFCLWRADAIMCVCYCVSPFFKQSTMREGRIMPETLIFLENPYYIMISQKFYKNVNFAKWAMLINEHQIL